MKLKYIFIPILLLFITPSCHDILDVVQTDRISSSNMWEDESDIKSATYGAFHYLRNTMKTNLIYWGEYRNGLWGAGTHRTLLNHEQSELISGTMSSTNSYASWENLYTTINLANLIIKYGETMDIDESSRDFALSNAYYIRAFCYYWIARIWGDAPLTLEGFESTAQEMYLPRSSQSDVFKQVELDLISSENHLTYSSSDKSIITPAALAMLKTDYGLWMYKVQNAGDSYLSYAENAISSLDLTPSKLETNYEDIFNSSNKRGKEVIFVIPNEYGESEGGFPVQHAWNRSYVDPAYADIVVPLGSNQWWLYTDDYIDLILEDPTDVRREISYGHGPYGSGAGKIGWANKYVGRLISGTRVFDSDIIVYRYAQAYMFDAEIKYYRKDYKGALNSLSFITLRAYNNTTYYNDESDSAVLNAIVKENLKEFSSEGNTWWTLIRTDALWDYNVNLATQKNRTNVLLWPITQSAINKNYNLTQTKGWEGQ